LSFDIQDRNGYSLPPYQTPMVLPVGAAGKLHARALEDLGDVDQSDALLARGKSGRHPIDDHVGAAAGDDLRWGDVRAAGLDGDIELLVLVEALFLGDVVAGELRLRHPLQLQGELVLRLGACARQGQRGRAGQDR
jgi:hypothetical protein